jgi:hypothetical protein
VLVNAKGCETDDGFNEGEVVGGDVAVKVESCPGIVVIGVPVCGDDEMSQEHD